MQRLILILSLSLVACTTAPKQVSVNPQDQLLDCGEQLRDPNFRHCGGTMSSDGRKRVCHAPMEPLYYCTQAPK